MIRVDYNSNNSGGSWWLRDEHWRALHDAGWTVHWVHPFEQEHDGHAHEGSKPRWGEHTHKYDDDFILVGVDIPAADGDRYMGALATSASKMFSSLEEGVREWENMTGKDAADEGCNCCGPPHGFSGTDENGGYHSAYIRSRGTYLEFD